MFDKYFKYIPVFIIWIIFILLYKFWITGLIQSELSYKMRGVEPRYVDKFRYTPIYKIPQITDPNFEISWNQYFQKLLEMKPNIDAIFLGKRINENILIIITDLGNYPIIAWVNNGIVTFSKGTDANIAPTAIFKVTWVVLDWLQQFFSDTILDAQEQYKIADVVMWPMIERLYRLSRFYKVSNMSSFGFDDFIQLEITGANNITRAGTPIELKYTIVNVDGQWIVNRGFIGDPDLRFSITLEEALSLYQTIVMDLENSKDKLEAMSYAKKSFEILKRNIIYTRDDHK